MKIAKKLAVVFTVLLIAFCQQKTFAQNYVQLINSQKILDDGVALYEEEKYEDAIKLYEKVPHGDTNYFAVQYEISLSYYKLKKYDVVIDMSKRLIAEGTTQIAQYNIWGSALDDLKRKDEAIAVYDAALKKYPFSTSLMLNKGIVYETSEDHKKAFEIYQQVLAISPLYASAHLRLASLAEKEGRQTQAIMAFAIFMMLEPDSRRTQNVLDEFNRLCNQSSNLIGSVKNTALDNEFEDIDFLVANQVALNDKYKVPGKMKYPLNRQLYLVMEKLAGKKDYSAGFYSKYYLAFFNDFLKTNSFEDFSLLMLASSENEKIAKEVKKKIENLKKCRDITLTKFKKMHPSYEGNLPGITEKLDFHYYKNYNPEALGNFNSQQKSVGKWIFFDTEGFIDVTGEFDNNGEKNGIWNYFNDKGDTLKSISYKAGIVDGIYKIYLGGRPKEMGNYVAGLVSGTVYEYYPDGAIKSKDNYEAGDRQGKGIQYFENGNVSYEYSFEKGEPSGSIKEYYNHGALKEESNYKAGKLEGALREYYENKQLKKECVFVNNLLEGPYKTYYVNGKLEREGIATKGNMSGKWIDYYSDGKISSISYLDESGKINGEEESFDHQGRKFRVDYYQKGDWKREQAYGRDGKLFYDVKILKSGSNVINYNYQLDKKSEGMLIDGERDGTWKFYYSNGDVSSTELYKKGKLEGVSKNFSENGKESGKYTYAAGERNGLEVLFHENGKIKSEGNYIEGNKWGVWNEYEPSGNISNSYFYHNDQKSDWAYEYLSNGKVYKKFKYLKGTLIEIHHCDTNGITIDSALIPTGTAHLVLKGLSGKKEYDGYMVNGLNHGKVNHYFFNNKVSIAGEYYMGYQHGDWIYYFPNGKVRQKVTLVYGDREGVWEYYNYFGEATRKFDYKNSKNHGKNYWYYDNGKVESESEYYEEDRHGASKYYAPNGELREVRFYEYGKLIGYSYMGKNGKLVDTIYTKTGDISLKAYYANGNVSTTYDIKAGTYNGPYKIYYPDGKIQEERMYDTGNEIAITKKYFPDGKVKRADGYLNGIFHGDVIEYNANGTMRMHEHYANGNLDGLCEYFDATGKRTNAYMYMNDEMIAVIQ